MNQSIFERVTAYIFGERILAGMHWVFPEALKEMLSLGIRITEIETHH